MKGNEMVEVSKKHSDLLLGGVMKVKLDIYCLNVLINRLYSQSKSYAEQTNYQSNTFQLQLVNISDTIKQNRRKSCLNLKKQALSAIILYTF
jgi:hypothetical protein